MSPKSDLISHSFRISPNFSSSAPSIFLIRTAVTVILSTKSRNQARTNIRAGIRTSIRPSHPPSGQAPSGFPYVFPYFSGFSSNFLRISPGFLLFPPAPPVPHKKRLSAKSTGHIAERIAEPIPVSLGFSFFFFCAIRRHKAGITAEFQVSAGAGEECSVGIRPTASGFCVAGSGKVP